MLKNRRESEKREIVILHEAIKLIPESRRRVAIDGGANVGHWTKVMAESFKLVYTYEPVNDTWEKLRENTKHLPNVHNIQKAILDKEQTVVMASPRNRKASTSQHVHYNATETTRPIDYVEATTIDLCNFSHCDLLKLDLEGAELRALHGAVETIKRCEPLILVEVINKQLKRYGDRVAEFDRFLTSLGYAQVMASPPNRVYRLGGLG